MDLFFCLFVFSRFFVFWIGGEVQKDDRSIIVSSFEGTPTRESRPTKAWQKSFLAEGTSGTGDERDEDEEDDDEECLHYRVRAPTATASLGRSRRRRPRRARSNDDRENNNNNNNNNNDDDDDDDDDVIDIARRRTRIKRPMGTHRTDERRCSER